MIDSHPLICINLPLVLIIKIKGIPANVIKLIKDRPPRERSLGGFTKVNGVYDEVFDDGYVLREIGYEIKL